MHDIYLTAAFILAGLLIYRFVLPRLKSFNDENVARIDQQAREKADPNAHIRHALDVASQQVEEVQEIVAGETTHYLFEAQVYASHDEAEDMRAQRIGVVARRFYEDLPAALMGRDEGRANLSARERASARWKKTVH